MEDHFLSTPTAHGLLAQRRNPNMREFVVVHTHSELRQRYIIKELPFFIKMENYMIGPNVNVLKTMTQNPICYVIIDPKNICYLTRCMH